MTEFDGSIKDLRCLFRTPKDFLGVGSLHQQICTSKNQYNLETDIALLGLQYTEDEQIGEIGFPEQMDVIKQRIYQNQGLV